MKSEGCLPCVQKHVPASVLGHIIPVHVLFLCNPFSNYSSIYALVIQMAPFLQVFLPQLQRIYRLSRSGYRTQLHSVIIQ